jgi:membrane protein insertase Oxa1/YidC/SpoIIIJ
VTADKNGYFVVTIEGLKAGEYTLFADATYNGHDSVSPSRFLKLKALGWWEQLLALLNQIWTWFVGLLVGTGIGLLWIGLPLIILIFILLAKIWPEAFTSIYTSRIIMFFAGGKKKKLHHAWFVGY